MKQLKSFKITEIGVPEHFDVRYHIKNSNTIKYSKSTIFLQLSDKCIERIHKNLKDAEIVLQIMDDHGRFRLELEDDEAAVNMYETEPLLEGNLIPV